jgi:hypothetical protein
MKSSTLMVVTAIALFAVLAIPLGVAAQEEPPGAHNPVPLINQPLVPDARKPGGKGFKLTVNGTGFVSNSVVNWNGSARHTTFVSRSQLRATILSSDISTATTASVTVVNPRPGGGRSNPVFFQVTLPSSAISLYRLDYNTESAPSQTPNSVVTVDFNKDGKQDIATANSRSNTVSVLLGKGDGTFQGHVDYGTGGSPQSVAVGDFNGDGKLDLAVANSATNTVSILLGNGDGTFQGHVDYGTGSGPTSVAAGDFNRDGNLDLAVTGGTVSVLLGNGDGTFQAHADYGTVNGPNSMAVGDFNWDGNLDLVVVNIYGSTVSVLLGNGDGSFRAQVDYETAYEPASVAVGDFNGDGKLDLAVASVGLSQVSVLLGNGDGSFQAHVEYATGFAPWSVVLGDFNGDGKVDLAVSNVGDNTASVLLGKGDGTFLSHEDYATGSFPYSIAVGDFNGDGRLNFVTGNDGDNTVSVFLRATTTAMVSPSSLSFADQLVTMSSAPQTVTLTNTGKAKLIIISIVVTGTDAGDFSQKNKCGSSLPPGASCKIRVSFKPTQIGPRIASLTIFDNASGGPQTVSLNGTGVTSGPNATLSATSLTFTCSKRGVNCLCSPSQKITLSNYGTKRLNITTITIRGSIDFFQTNTCGRSLGAGKSCDITVSWNHVTSTGAVKVSDNAPGSPQTVSLTGTNGCTSEARIDRR